MITLGGVPVICGELSLPTPGTWRAALDLSGTPPEGKVELNDGAGSVYVGTTRERRILSSRGYALVIGGTDGLRATQEPQHFRSTNVGQVLDAILAAAGEARDATVLPDYLSTGLSFWSTTRASGGANLSSLLSPLGLIWRVRQNGQVWVGSTDDELETPGQSFVLDGQPYHGAFDCAPGGFWLQPGMVQNEGIVCRVEYKFGDILRARFWVNGE